MLGLGSGEYFDDSFLPDFTPDHYLSGFITSNIDQLISCQFIYKSSRDNQSRIASPVHGDSELPINSTHVYRIDDDDRICAAFVTWDDKNLTDSNGTHFTSRTLFKLQFITEKNRLIPLYSGPLHPDLKCKHDAKYVLAYVTGKTAGRITQLQFIWYIFES